jgi:hypothetical protein
MTTAAAAEGKMKKKIPQIKLPIANGLAVGVTGTGARGSGEDFKGGGSATAGDNGAPHWGQNAAWMFGTSCPQEQMVCTASPRMLQNYFHRTVP